MSSKPMATNGDNEVPYANFYSDSYGNTYGNPYGNPYGIPCGYPPNLLQQSDKQSDITDFLLKRIGKLEKENFELLEEIKKLKDRNNKLYDDNCKLDDDYYRLKRMDNKRKFEDERYERYEKYERYEQEPLPKKNKHVLCRHYHHKDGKKICSFGDNCDFLHSINGHYFRTIKCKNLNCANPKECTFRHDDVEQLKPIKYS